MKHRVFLRTVAILTLLWVAAGVAPVLAQGCPDCDQAAPPAPAAPPSPLQGDTYVTDQDNEDNAHSGNPDYDMYPENPCVFNDEDVAPIEFNINVTGALPTHDATLTLYVWDVDEEGEPGNPDRPVERDEVYFNGHLLGTLTGAGDTWSTSVFPLDISYVQSGNNLVEIQIDLDNGDWCVGVDWGQLLVDGGTGAAAITSMTTDNDCYEVATSVVVNVQFVIDVTEGDAFDLETNLLDPDNITVDSDTYSFSANSGDTVNYAVDFVLSDASTPGTYTVNASLFSGEGGVLQDVKVITFEYAASCGQEPTPTPTEPPPPTPPPAEPPPVVPEASTLILLGSGVAGLASYIGLQLRARRRK